MPDPEPSKRTVQMYDRPAGADNPPLPTARIALIAVAVIAAAIFGREVYFPYPLWASSACRTLTEQSEIAEQQGIQHGNNGDIDGR